MTAKIIDGNVIAQQIKDEVAAEVETLAGRGVEVGLMVVLVGDHPSSVSYVRGKTRDAAAAGMRSETLRLPAETTQGELLNVVAELNDNPGWHGILVQLPLPGHIDERTITEAILPEKDVDGLHPVNVGRLFRGEPAFISCTPHGVIQMLMRSGHDPVGKHAVVCGRSNLVGKPLAGLLMQKRPGGNATVTVCHTATPDIGQFTRQADILVAVMGQAGAITEDMVREGAVVIDVGVNAIPDASKKSGQRLVGDVDFEAVSRKAAAITPVPGGVGPMTRAMLLWNTVIAASGGPEAAEARKSRSS
jgi:methylenetetrahydrofolate dehydrogenase (NADP+)/methenyltetrahydrofolate cyclohydrolase